MRLALTLAIALMSACGAGTEGELVQIDLSIENAPQGKRPLGTFATSTGFSVTLEEARLELSSVLVYARESSARTALSSFWLGRALAHGGFDPFNGKRVRVEYAEPFTIDLLETRPRALGPVDAEAGAMESATLVFSNLPDAAGQAYVRGTARRDGETIPFAGTLELEDEALLRRVDGIAAKGKLTAGGTLAITIKPHLFFDEAHFERLEGEGESSRAITTSTQAHTAWVFGVRSTRSYQAEWKKP